VHKVEGLAFPSFSTYHKDKDMSHGDSVWTKWSKAKRISLQGILYLDPSTLAIFDTLATSFLPDGVEYPFYYKYPGLTQRYIMCQPDEFPIQIDLETAMRTGQTPFKINLIARYPVSYVNLSNLSLGDGTWHSITNAGNAPTYVSLFMDFPATAVTMSGWEFGIYSTNDVGGYITSLRVTKTYTSTVVTDTTLDMQNRTITGGFTLNDCEYGETGVSPYRWWSLPPGTWYLRWDIYQSAGTTPTTTAYCKSGYWS
jgi:hypothetical protein